MKKSNFLKLVILVTTIALHGCGTYGKIIPVPAEGQKLVHKVNGLVITSDKRNTVSLKSKFKRVSSGQRADFILNIKNKSSKNIKFSIRDISANSYVSDINNMQPLEIFSRERLVKNEKNRQIREGIDLILGSLVLSNSERRAYDIEVTRKTELGKKKLQKLQLLVSRKAVTILPGERMSGILRVRLPKITEVTENIVFTVNVDKEKHKLTFIQERIEKK